LRLDVDAQREATHFKNRVLDLVDIFIKKQPTSQHIIHVILPLADVIAGTGSDERQLADKATGLLRNRLGKSKDLPSDIDSEETVTVLDELHRRARRARSSEVLATLSQCSLYLSKVMLQSKAEESVLRVYRASLVDFITRKASTLNATFFHDFIRRYPASGWSLRGDVIDASCQATNVYRQCQAFQLLHTIVNQIPALVRETRHHFGFILKNFCRRIGSRKS
jgi:DNA polymerase phi